MPKHKNHKKHDSGHHQLIVQKLVETRPDLRTAGFPVEVLKMLIISEHPTRSERLARVHDRAMLRDELRRWCPADRDPAMHMEEWEEELSWMTPPFHPDAFRLDPATLTLQAYEIEVTHALTPAKLTCIQDWLVMVDAIAEVRFELYVLNRYACGPNNDEPPAIRHLVSTTSVLELIKQPLNIPLLGTLDSTEVEHAVLGKPDPEPTGTPAEVQG